MFKNAKLLYVDLAKKSTEVKELPAETFKKYPGGSALGMYLMLKEMDPKVDPLSPDNMLVFAVSPLAGYPISGLARMTVTTKSPLTGTAGDSQVGGFIPAHLAATGYMAIVFKGKASSPVYLYVDKDKAEVRDASKMWGKTTDAAEDAIEADLGDKNIEMAVIGPAGENLVNYAAIIHMKNRAAGRNGTGAVMGSKNLKAIAIKKQSMPKAVDPDGLKTLTADVKERIEANGAVDGMGIYGTASVVDEFGAIGVLPSKNWGAGVYDGWKDTGGEKMSETVLVGRDTCFACAIRCKRDVEIPGKVDKKYGGPEYETCATFGSYCGNSSLEDICVANMLCNMYGLDTISCGATIAWAMDCFENGILTTKDTDGIELKFGNGKAFEPLIKKIAMKEDGIGKLLAEGSARAAKTLGAAAEELVVATKGQEWPAHMAQFKPNLAVNYAVNNFGADHQSSEHDPALMAPEDDQNWLWPNMLEKFDKVEDVSVLDDNKAKFAFATQKFYSMMDTLGLCQFVFGPAWQLYGPGDVVTTCKATIGWDASIAELQEIGERRLVMMRMFNVKNGFSRKDDTVPKKAYIPIVDADGNTHQINEKDFEAALDAYYKHAGWDNNGVPTVDTLKRLGLDWI